MDKRVVIQVIKYTLQEQEDELIEKIRLATRSFSTPATKSLRLPLRLGELVFFGGTRKEVRFKTLVPYYSTDK